MTFYRQNKNHNSLWPGFDWDRVNVHKKLGGDTARPADPNWPGERDIPHHAGFLHGGAGRGRVTAVRARAGHWALRKWHRVSFGFVYPFYRITGGVLFAPRCSVKLSLSQPTRFAFSFQLSSPSHCGGTDRAAARFSATSQGRATTPPAQTLRRPPHPHGLPPPRVTARWDRRTATAGEADGLHGPGRADSQVCPKDNHAFSKGKKFHFRTSNLSVPRMKYFADDVLADLIQFVLEKKRNRHYVYPGLLTCFTPPRNSMF